jgi:hypothetical protein
MSGAISPNVRTNRKGMITRAATRDLMQAKDRAEKLAIGEVAELACVA